MPKDVGVFDNLVSDEQSATSTCMAANWTADKGWRGLILGGSTVQNVIDVLGSPSDRITLEDGKVYGFCANTIEATFLSDKPQLFRLKVHAKYKGPEAPPKTLEDVRKIFPSIQEQAGLSRYKAYLSDSSVTVCCNKQADSGSVLWIEFTLPETL